MASNGPILVCADCGHDELDHGDLSHDKPYEWGCSQCGCKRLRAVEAKNE